MDVFQTDEFRPGPPPRPATAPIAEAGKRTSYPYTTGVLAVTLAIAGGFIAGGLSGTPAFGWAAAAWLLIFSVLLGRLITALANRRVDR